MDLIKSHHHLTLSVGGAREDYDFHTRLLGLRSVKKTVLFDGKLPIHHLCYGNYTGGALFEDRRRETMAVPEPIDC